MSKPSALPDTWIVRIWTTMRATYGAAFDRQWEAPAGVDPVEHVKAMRDVWARELAGFQSNPQALAHGLDHLPDTVPNLKQFAALCRNVPVMAQPALPAPPADPQRVQAALERVKAPAGVDPKGWAKRLVGRAEGGEAIPVAHLAMARAALGLDKGASTYKEAA